jgi:hypothetical protein
MSEEEVREVTYEPLGASEFGAAEIFAQGAAALDLAAIFALERRDVDGLVKVAREWTRMGAAVLEISGDDDTKKTPLKFGFRGEIAEEEKNGEPGKSISEDKFQAGRFRLRKH